MIYIPLTRGYVAMIDDVDADLADGSWSAHAPKKGGVYARGWAEGKLVMLHRVIAARCGLCMDVAVACVDHKNGDQLDCRRGNLRSASWQDNARNIKAIARNNTSGYLGVSYYKQRANWRASIRLDGRCKTLGYFKTAELANDARLAAEREFWGIHPQRIAAHVASMQTNA